MWKREKLDTFMCLLEFECAKRLRAHSQAIHGSEIKNIIQNNNYMTSLANKYNWNKTSFLKWLTMVSPWIKLIVRSTFTDSRPYQYAKKLQSSGPRFNIKMTSYQHRKSHCGDKTILRPSYLHNGISYTGKMISLYWIRALLTFSMALKMSLMAKEMTPGVLLSPIMVKVLPEAVWP